MGYQKVKLICLFILLLIATSMQANKRDKEIEQYIKKLNQETHPVGFQQNKDKVEYIFETWAYIQKTKSCEDKLLQSFYSSSLAFLLQKAKLYKLALKLNKELIRKIDCNKDILSYLLIHNAAIHQKLGNYDECIVAYNQALDIAREINDLEKVARIYQHINYVYWHKDLQNGIGISEMRNKMGHKILDIYIETNDELGIQTSSTELGMSASNIEDAVKYFEKSLSIIAKKEQNLDINDEKSNLSNVHEKNYTLIHYARTLTRLNSHEAAYDKIQRIDPTQIGGYSDSLDYLLMFSEYHTAVKDFKSANHNIDDCKRLLDKLENTDLNKLQYLRSFAKSFETMKDYRNLAITNESISQIIINTRFGSKFFDTEITRFLSDLDENEKKIMENKEKMSRMKYGIFIIAGVLFLSLITGFFYRKLYQTRILSLDQIKKEQQKLVAKNIIIVEKNAILDKQTSELEAQLRTKLLMLSNKKMMLKSLTDEIDSLPIEYERRKALKDVVLETENKEIWNRVEEDFLELHKEFAARLLNINPNLTPNNINLCIFIKLGLSNKEIAELKFTTSDSIKVAKNRLSKLLNLVNNDESIYVFLKKLNTSDVEFT